MSTEASLLMSTTRVVGSLITDKLDNTRRVIAKQNAGERLAPPVNSEAECLGELLGVAQSRPTSIEPRPYWREGVRYCPFEVFISTVNFFDRHNEPIPTTTVPPETDVKAFTDCILGSDKRLTLRNQFETLLDLSGGSIPGAANIGFLATRLLARGCDMRVYPNIPLDLSVIREANKRLAQFESYSDEDSDALGDTYYFWTHFFAACVYNELGGRHSKLLNQLFAVGTPLMRFARKYIAQQPTIGHHREASILGRHVGLAIGDLVA